jgi:hypothetical protein
MFSTTLRIPDELGTFLQEAARASALSVNTFLVSLIARERDEAKRRRLAKDWAAYGQGDQEVSYALPAQAEVLAEARGSQKHRASESIRLPKSLRRKA